MPIFSISTLAYEIVEKNKECREVGRSCPQSSLEGCARACQNLSHVFVYEEKSHQGPSHNCYCEVEAFLTGKCNLKDAPGHNLYKYHGN